MRRPIRRAGRGGPGSGPDDWSSPHDRARSLAAARLDGPLDEAATPWLDEHLAGCATCLAAADDYATQRTALRALRDHEPEPPRDLWARTAAAIEREAGFRSRTSRRRSPRALLAPYAILSGALAVALVVGTLTSSQGPRDLATAAPDVATSPLLASTGPTVGAPTPMIVGPGSVAWLSRDDGEFNINTANVERVCPSAGEGCAPTEPNRTQQVQLMSDPSTVYGSPDGRRLITLGANKGGSGASVYVVPVEQVSAPTATPPPTVAPTTPPAATPTPPTGSPTPTDVAPSSPPVATASPTAPIVTASPISPSPFQNGALEIARGVRVVESTAAYAPDGSAFAFTAYPADGSHGPDIYIWRVGDPAALALTTDHRSVFGSWLSNSIVGSTVEPRGDDRGRPAAFELDPVTGLVRELPRAGRAWRPAVDPTGSAAVYWTGDLDRTDEDLGWATRDGRLVIGPWTADGDDASDRNETRLARGPLTDWEARWDETGTRLAVWIADRDDPTLGRLSLYIVDPFDGRIDQDDPPLEDEPALAGISIGDGRLAWAAPPDEGSQENRVRILAWTDAGFGEVESAPGDVIVVR